MHLMGYIKMLRSQLYAKKIHMHIILQSRIINLINFIAARKIMYILQNGYLMKHIIGRSVLEKSVLLVLPGKMLQNIHGKW